MWMCGGDEPTDDNKRYREKEREKDNQPGPQVSILKYYRSEGNTGKSHENHAINLTLKQLGPALQNSFKILAMCWIVSAL